MNKFIRDVDAWHKAFDVPVKDSPCIPEFSRTELRYQLLYEELHEYRDAVKVGDLIEVADALADLMYVLCGTILEHGLQNHFGMIWDEVQRSNMSKLGEDSKPVRREDWKILKGPNFSPPDIASQLAKPPRFFDDKLSDDEIKRILDIQRKHLKKIIADSPWAPKFTCPDNASEIPVGDPGCNNIESVNFSPQFRNYDEEFKQREGSWCGPAIVKDPFNVPADMQEMTSRMCNLCQQFTGPDIVHGCDRSGNPLCAWHHKYSVITIKKENNDEQEKS